eukprot:gene13482-9290_t
MPPTSAIISVSHLQLRIRFSPSIGPTRNNLTSVPSGLPNQWTTVRAYLAPLALQSASLNEAQRHHHNAAPGSPPPSFPSTTAHQLGARDPDPPSSSSSRPLAYQAAAPHPSARSSVPSSSFSSSPSLWSSRAEGESKPFKPEVGEGWRSLEHYPAWTDGSAVSNHVGNLGVMSLLPRVRATASEMAQNVDPPPHEHLPPQTAMPTTTRGNGELNREAWERQRQQKQQQKQKEEQRKRNSRGSGRYSGVQLEVLGQYRRFLHAASRIQDETSRANLTAHIREKFDEGAALPGRKLDAVEWRLNYGKRKLEEVERLATNATFRFVQ